ncbi:hypothetical protein [Sporomusa acidovorans]|uniref:Carbohydrate-binding domain-containing protein n=2 Tax=Sporomusa TaxID=2375 RepID=A0ABZ3J5S5_SPOA4|nr:hypothetical protein [Sporomusa acidovorans]
MMKKNFCLTMLLLVSLFSARPIFAVAAPNLVAQWAPVIYQTDSSDNLTAQQNVFTSVNYDLDWRSSNNGYNLRFYPMNWTMYYSVVESDTHYFIAYYQYYPRYLHDGENKQDMTGVLVAVSKTSDGSGRLDMLLTYSNKDWRKWEGSKVQLEGGHPALTISAATHAITAGKKRYQLSRTDGVYLKPSPANLMQADDQELQGGFRAGYRLIPLTQLWEHCQDIGPGRVFARWGYLDSNNSSVTTAPWVWGYHQINWLSQPGELVQRFQRLPFKPVNYLNNIYR